MEAQVEDRFLIPQLVPNPWGQGKELDKCNIIQEFLGDTPLLTNGNRKDSQNMDNYLKNLEPSSLQVPDLVPQASFMPEESPLLNFLPVFTEAKDDSWGFPRLSLLKQLQANRGPSYALLETCKVREIIIGQTSEDEIEDISIWRLDQMERDEISLPCSGLPFDTHVQRVTLYDLYRLWGRIPFKYPKHLVFGKLDPECFQDLLPDE